MTLNIIFFSITFNKRKESLQEAVHNEMVEMLYQQTKERQAHVHQLI